MKQTFKNEMRELMTKSWVLVRQYGFTMPEAMKHMWQVMKLKKRMAKGVVKFLYTKLDGSTRMAWGTLCGALMPQTERESGRRTNDTVTTYYDTEKQSFRCFKTANFIKII